MKIVVLDRPRENPGEICWSQLEELGEVAIYDRTPVDKIIERIGNAEIVLLNKSVITRETLDACPNIKFISVIATGYDTVDVHAAQEKGIPVAFVPAYGTEAIAQHAIALLLEITNHIAHHDSEVRKGRRNNDKDWCFWDYPSIELENKVMGIIGFGRIGKIVARVASAFGMKVIAYDSYAYKAPLDGETCYVSLDELFERSDVISLHCPLSPENVGMINKNTISKMKDGVIIINNSRGGLIADQDLADALNCGKIYAAGLDTIANEPIELNNPLLHAKNCFITPHISWAAIECRQRLINLSINNVRQYLNGTPVNIVEKLC